MLLGPERPCGHVVVAGRGVPVVPVVCVRHEAAIETVVHRGAKRRGADVVGAVGAEGIELDGAEASGLVGWGHFCLVGA